MKNRIGFSAYLSEAQSYDETYIKKMAEAGYTLAFTSLHIPEETITIKSLKRLILLYHAYDILVCADISPVTLTKLQIESVKDLYEVGIDYVRFDYGIPFDEIQALDKANIMINASTIQEEELKGMLAHGVCSEQILAVHNYYPKPYTGLSIAFLKQQNELLHRYNIETIAFIPGFKKARGPLHEFLPTIEDHRYKDALASAMELIHAGDCDGIMIGDPLADPQTMKYVGAVVQKTFVFPMLSNNDLYSEGFKDGIWHQRFDESEYTIRLRESRVHTLSQEKLEPIAYANEIQEGTVFISNVLFGRYCGEIQIARRCLPYDCRVNIIGQINTHFLHIVKYVKGDSPIIFID